MIRFIFQRLGFYLLAGLVAVTANFFIPRLMPGDPASVMFARFKGKLEPEALEAMKESFGLSDAPIWQQYFEYASSLLHGDLGTSLVYFPMPVGSIMVEGLLWTTFLAGTSLVISFVGGTMLGAWLAWKREGRLDTVLPPLLSLIGAFPYFWMAMLFLSVFGFSLGWFPTRHAYASGLEPGFTVPFAVSAIQHAFLPALTMVIASVGGWMLSMRNVTVSTLGTEFVYYAHIRGLSEKQVWWRYAVRNALIPNVTGFGMALGFVLSGALLTEMVFGYPGQGYLLIQAVNGQDFPLMQGIFSASPLPFSLPTSLSISYRFGSIRGWCPVTKSTGETSLIGSLWDNPKSRVGLVMVMLYFDRHCWSLDSGRSTGLCWGTP